MQAASYQISYVRVGSSDLQKSRAFYEDVLGLPLVIKNIERGYLLFEMTGITLIVEEHTPDDEPLPSSRYLGISLKVKKINKVYKALTKRGVEFTQPPKKQFWGGYLTEFKDPDGNVWTLLG